MIDFTPLSKPYMARVYAAEQQARRDVEHSQKAVLRKLLRAGRSTQWGRSHAITPGISYADYAARVPLVTYEDIRPEVERMLRGEKNILWPGVCHRYAQSSGTSGGKSKYIPLPADSLQGCHYAGAAYSLASYLHYYPDSHIFGGKNFILGGSYANEIADLPEGVKVGDLSASLIDRINPLVNLLRIPDKTTALLPDWQEKLPRLVEASLRADVRSISGVPSWFLTVLKELLARAGKENIHELWPSLEVFFHGGIAFGPYREQYAHITDTRRMRYWENYNASEGFFAVQQEPAALPGAPAPMGLLMHADVFYEFMPAGSDTPLPAWEVIPGEVYELVITSSNGLWRYRLGDTVKVVTTSPLTIEIAGRTQAFINAFGEELMVCNAEAAMAAVCRATGAEVADYTAAPVYAGDNTRGRHQWLVEFNRLPACTPEEFADRLDKELQHQNSDYQAKRSGGIFLDRLELISAPAGTFNRWLAATGKLGGQRKVPRLCNDRRIMSQLLSAAHNTPTPQNQKKTYNISYNIAMNLKTLTVAVLAAATSLLAVSAAPKISPRKALKLVNASQVKAPQAPRYIFYFIGDGMGWPHLINADLYKTDVLGQESMAMLNLPVAGLARTHSANSRVTDSAAAGTALSTAHKTKNGMLGMDADTIPVTSIAKILYDRGWGVGLVTTSAIDDATPGAFYAHVPNRGNKMDIARQMAESGYQFLAGAGPQKLFRTDKDGKKIIDYIKEQGYTVGFGKTGLDEVSDKMLVVSADTVKTWECDYTIDSVPDALHLPDMTAAAIRQLSRLTPDHFFLMVEGGIIDHAAHGNDGGTAVREVLAFNESIQLALDFYNSHPQETLIVITADHETGGYSVGNQTTGYSAHPEVVRDQKMSKSAFDDLLKSMARSRRIYGWDDMHELLATRLGFWGAVPVTDQQTAELKEMFEKMMEGRNSAPDQKTLYASFSGFTARVFQILNDAAGYGFTTTCHTGSPVPVLAIGEGAQVFSSLNDNTDLPVKILRLALGNKAPSLLGK